MAKGSGKKGSKKRSRATGGPRQRAARLEKALAAGLKREAKAASRLEASQLEVAVLRMALAEVIGEGPAVAESATAVAVVVPPEPKAMAARPRAPRTPAAAKSPAARKTPAATKPSAAAKSPAAAKPHTASPAAAKAPAGRPRRITRPAPADR